jgi:hypothetical protein
VVCGLPVGDNLRGAPRGYSPGLAAAAAITETISAAVVRKSRKARESIWDLRLCGPARSGVAAQPLSVWDLGQCQLLRIGEVLRDFTIQQTQLLIKRCVAM